MTKKNVQKKLRWLVLPLFLLGLGTLQAQNFISSDEAMVKLELKLADIYNGVEKGTVLSIDKDIADKFINKAAMEISSNKTIAIALDNALTETNKAYFLYKSNIITLKNEITELLKRKE